MHHSHQKIFQNFMIAIGSLSMVFWKTKNVPVSFFINSVGGNVLLIFFAKNS